MKSNVFWKYVTALAVLPLLMLLTGLRWPLRVQPVLEEQLRLPAGGGVTSIALQAQRVEVSRRGVVHLNRPFSERKHLMITGTPREDDCFRVALTENVRGRVSVEGGEGGYDILDLVCPAASRVVYFYDNAHDGRVEFDYDADSLTDFTVEYSGLEPITSSIMAAHVVLNYGGSAETITLTDGGGGQTTVASTAGELTTFNNPTGSLTLNAGGGDDSIVIGSFSSSFDADLSINGESGNDAFSVNAATDLGAGALTVSCETLNTSAAVNSSTGNIDIDCDHIVLGATLESAGVLMIQPHNAGVTIGVGGGSGTLNLDVTELAYLSDGFTEIVIGDGSSGTLDIGSAVFGDRVSLASGGAIHDGSGTDVTAPWVGLFGEVAPGQSPGVLSITGNFIFGEGASFSVELGGAAPGTASNQHDQIVVTGTVDLGSNVVLSVSAWDGYAPSGGEDFVLIANDGADAVSGTFMGLAEGATFSSNFLGSGLAASISYQGGDGNDVVLTVADNSLPVAFSRFEAVRVDEGVQLDWTTESETDNLGFILQRRLSEGTAWLPLASYVTHADLMGRGNGAESREYQFLDSDVSAGQALHYRLSSVDVDGSTQVCAVVEIILPEAAIPTALRLYPVFPNPMTEAATCILDLPERGRAVLEVVDLRGRRVRTLLNRPMTAGTEEICWDGTDDSGAPVPSGLYIVILKTAAGTRQQKVAVMLQSQS